MYEKLKAILGQINSDENFDPANIVVRTKEILQSKHLEIYQEWAKEDFNINHLFSFNENDELSECTTLLHIATSNNYVKVLNALIKEGANVNAIDNQGKTPLHWAAKKGHIKIVEALITADANVNAIDNQGRTPLHLAAKKDKVEVIKALIAAHAEIDAKDNYENTPLHYAAKYSDTDAIGILIEKGANIHTVEKSLHREITLHLKPIIAGAATFCVTAALEAGLLVLIIAKGDFPVKLFPMTIAVLTIAAVSLITGTIAYKAFEPRTQVKAADANIASGKGYVACEQ